MGSFFGAIKGIFTGGSKKQEDNAPDVKAETLMQVAAPAAPVLAAEPKMDAQLIAVITAALMAFEQNGKRLVVRSVRKVNPSSNWVSAGRQEQINY